MASRRARPSRARPRPPGLARRAGRARMPGRDGAGREDRPSAGGSRARRHARARDRTAARLRARKPLGPRPASEASPRRFRRRASRILGAVPRKGPPHGVSPRAPLGRGGHARSPPAHAAPPQLRKPRGIRLRRVPRPQGNPRDGVPLRRRCRGTSRGARPARDLRVPPVGEGIFRPPRFLAGPGTFRGAGSGRAGRNARRARRRVSCGGSRPPSRHFGLARGSRGRGGLRGLPLASRPKPVASSAHRRVRLGRGRGVGRGVLLCRARPRGRGDDPRLRDGERAPAASSPLAAGGRTRRAFVRGAVRGFRDSRRGAGGGIPAFVFGGALSRSGPPSFPGANGATGRPDDARATHRARGRVVRVPCRFRLRRYRSASRLPLPEAFLGRGPGQPPRRSAARHSLRAVRSPRGFSRRALGACGSALSRAGLVRGFARGLSRARARRARVGERVRPEAHAAPARELLLGGARLSGSSRARSAVVRLARARGARDRDGSPPPRSVREGFSPGHVPLRGSGGRRGRRVPGPGGPGRRRGWSAFFRHRGAYRRALPRLSLDRAHRLPRVDPPAVRPLRRATVPRARVPSAGVLARRSEEFFPLVQGARGGNPPPGRGGRARGRRGDSRSRTLPREGSRSASRRAAGRSQRLVRGSPGRLRTGERSSDRGRRAGRRGAPCPAFRLRAPERRTQGGAPREWHVEQPVFRAGGRAVPGRRLLRSRKPFRVPGRGRAADLRGTRHPAPQNGPGRGGRGPALARRALRGTRVAQPSGETDVDCG
ncbi:MAG: hypothetical protein KatS3mg076_1925 [Candidatus Binatia bacterium]|nr:MAG: hypothetical protein KatS3mg076_1925 [Candidatus Binatia bacterium]